MSSTIYTDIKVFSVQLPKPVVCNSLFPIETGIIVLAQTYDSNVFPCHPKWSFLFVGEESEFLNDALPDIKASFDSGMGCGSIAANGSELGELMIELLKGKSDALCITLNNLGFEGYSLSECEFEKVECKHGFFAKKQFNEVRYCHPFYKLPDLKKMVYNVLTSKAKSEEQKRWWDCRPFKVESFNAVLLSASV